MLNRSLMKSGGQRDLSSWSGLRSDLWDLFDRFSRDLETPFTSETQEFIPKIEVQDRGNSYLVCAEVPGMSENDINVTLKDNNLIIEGEKKNEFKKEDTKKGYFHSEFSYGRFYRAIPLSDDVDENNVNATYRNGVLDIELQKLPEKANKQKKIQISTSGKSSGRSEQKH